MNANRVTSDDLLASIKFHIPMSPDTVRVLATQQNELLDLLVKLVGVGQEGFDEDVVEEIRTMLHDYGRNV